MWQVVDGYGHEMTNLCESGDFVVETSRKWYRG